MGRHILKWLSASSTRTLLQNNTKLSIVSASFGKVFKIFNRLAYVYTCCLINISWKGYKSSSTHEFSCDAHILICLHEKYWASFVNLTFCHVYDSGAPTTVQLSYIHIKWEEFMLTANIDLWKWKYLVEFH